MPDRQELLEVFSPAKELLRPERFAGRRDEVLRLTDSLLITGSCPVIFGHRGLGKSSLAAQMERIAKGDVELLAELQAQDRAVREQSQYVVLFVTCTQEIATFHNLLQAMINAAEGLTMMGDERRGASFLVDRTTRHHVSAKIFQLETVRRYEREKPRESYADLSLPERLDSVCRFLSDFFTQPVLFIIDELDLVDNTDGLASLIKAQSSGALKFMLVGIAENLADLLADHRSIERIVRSVEVRLMHKAELIEIIDRAEVALKELGVEIRFTDDAKDLAASVADGFPWFVHLLGQSALIRAYDDRRQQVEAGDILAAINGIVRHDLAQSFETTYKQAVGASRHREIFLRACAEWSTSQVQLRDIYAAVRTLGVGSPSPHKMKLCQPEHGEVLMNPGGPGPQSIKFTNQMFKIYVRLRPSIADGVDGLVREAFGRRLES